MGWTGQSNSAIGTNGRADGGAGRRASCADRRSSRNGSAAVTDGAALRGPQHTRLSGVVFVRWRRREGSGLLRLLEDPIDLGNALRAVGSTTAVSQVFLASPAALVVVQTSSCSSGKPLGVLGLEVVGPQHPEVVLHGLRPLFFDHDEARWQEHGIVGHVELLHAGLHRLRLDTSLRGVVDAARQVAVSEHGARGRDPVGERVEVLR